MSSGARQVAAGPRVAPLAQLVNDWLAACLRAAPKQIRQYRHVVETFAWQAGACVATDVTPAAVGTYLGRLRAMGQSTATLANHGSALRLFGQWLKDTGRLPANPCASIRLKKPKPPPPNWLRPAEVAQVLALADEAGCWPHVALAIGTGLRLGELRVIRWADVDLPGRTLLVPVGGRTGKCRVVPLCNLAVDALTRQKALTGHLQHAFPARHTWRGGWAWIDRPAAPNTWFKLLRPIQQAMPAFARGLQAGSVGRGWHLARHTFASVRAQKGTSIYKISAWLGHSSLEMTKRYSHLQEGYDPDVE